MERIEENFGPGEGEGDPKIGVKGDEDLDEASPERPDAPLSGLFFLALMVVAGGLAWYIARKGTT